MAPRILLIISLIGTGIITSGVPLIAHHSIVAEFDPAKVVTLDGTITKLEWTNPHSYFYIDVRDAKTGQVHAWTCEMGSLNSLIAQGWTQNTVHLGAMVSVTGSLARDGTKKLFPRKLTLDGRSIGPGSSTSGLHR